MVYTKEDKICGIYCIENLVNNNKYIGESIDILSRWKQHISDLKNNSHDNAHLQAAWNLYKPESFNFFVLELCDLNNLSDREKYWISFYDSFYHGYNQTLGGEGCLGYTHSDSIKEKMRNIKLERFKDIENRKKLSEAHEFESLPIYQIDFNGNIVKKMDKR